MIHLHSVVVRKMINKVDIARFIIFTTGATILYLTIHQIIVMKQEDVMTKEMINLIGQDIKYAEILRKPDKLPHKVKYLLWWTQEDFYPFYTFSKGQRSFIEEDCPSYNCFVTSNRNFFGSDLTKFDAIGFNVRNKLNDIKLPSKRLPHQLYIFFGTESSDYYPVCLNVYDGFFNLTSTYKLDSDIIWNYFEVFDKEEKIVAPKVDPKWVKITTYEKPDRAFEEKFKRKTKIGAWFVSNCIGRSGRQGYVEKLQNALKFYGSNIDIYGGCGTLKCPRNNSEYCNKKLEDEYFFYLAFENSFAEDYITEKVVTALNNHVVPVVFGGANNSRFLPPGSYIDARAYTPSDLANLLNITSQSVKLYNQYFRWKKHYTIRMSPTRICEVCAALNNDSLVPEKDYRDFRKWWNPDFKKRCNG